MEDIKNFLIVKLIKFGIAPTLADEFSTVLLFLVLTAIAFLLRYFSRKVLVKWINHVFKRTKNQFDDILVDHKIFHKLTHFVPGLILLYSSPLIISSADALAFVVAIIKIYLTIVSVFTFSSTISAFHDMYKKLPVSINVQIVGYVQVIKILIHIIGAVLILSVLLNQSPYALLTSLGAMAAIIVLVFRDTILGFVANVQLSANNMVRPGDWITVKDKADGTVLDISLTTVKVQNFDKTITMLPTSSLVQSSFVNWKGMLDGDGRRIKTYITIQTDTIRFADAPLMESLQDIPLLAPLLNEELKKRKGQLPHEGATNIGLYRKYIEFYLHEQRDVNPDMTFLVRHLQNKGEGAPIEIYVFSRNKDWPAIESLQADILEHLYAIVARFELKVFQKMSINN